MIRYVTLFVVSVFAVGTWAQSPQHHAIDPSQVTVVDGSKNPELIPDSTAYRLWLLTVSLPPNATDADRTLQQAHLSKLRLLADADRLALLSVLTEFKSKYLALVGNFNEAETAALLKGNHADKASFLRQREALVSDTRITIKQLLTPDGADRVDAHVKGEKQHMQIHTTGGGEQP